MNLVNSRLCFIHTVCTKKVTLLIIYTRIRRMCNICLSKLQDIKATFTIYTYSTLNNIYATSDVCIYMNWHLLNVVENVYET